MIATRDEITTALRGAIEEAGNDKNVIVPVLFLQDVLEALEGEEDDGK